MLFFRLIIVKMPKIVGILIFMNRKKSLLSLIHNPSSSGSRDIVLNKGLLLL